MATTDLSLKEIFDLAKEVLEFNGCDETSSNAVANTVYTAERDGSASHGLFRIPGYVKSLKSKKVNGKANPTINNLTQNAIRVDGDYGFAPVAINVGIPALIDITKKHGIGVLTITNTHHFAALWPETEALAEADLVLAVGTELSETDSFVEILEINGELIRIDIDSSKIKKVLGWQPKYSFQSGIEKTIEHYKKSI